MTIYYFNPWVYILYQTYLDNLLINSSENDFVINGMISTRINSIDSPSLSRKDFIDLFKLYPIGPCSKLFKNKIKVIKRSEGRNHG